MAENQGKEEQEKEEIIIKEESDKETPKEEDSEDDGADKGELDSSAEDESAKPKKKPIRKRNESGAQKIKELWAKQKDLERENAQINSLAAGERIRSAKMEEITRNALEDSLKNKSENLQLRLLNAQEKQDNEEITKVTVELTKVQAQSAQLERYKIENSVKPQHHPAPAQNHPQQRQQQEIGSLDDLYEVGSQATKRWLDENRDWYDDNSENYDSERAEDVKYFANNLEKKLAREGREEEIGTTAYYRKINEYVRDNWQEEESDDAPKKNGQRQLAVPVGGRSNQQQRNPGRKQYVLTGAERDMAVSMELKHPNGVQYSDEEKMRSFAKSKDLVKGNQPISINTLKKGAM